MKMYKTLIILVTVASSLVTTQCTSTKAAAQEQELSNPEFATHTVYFNSYTEGKEQGRVGYELHLEQLKLPETLILEAMVFSNHIGSVHKTARGYKARVQKIKVDQDVVMSSNPDDEAGNTPPVYEGSFPFSLKEGEVGVKYTDNGVVKYTVMKNILQREPIIMPGSRTKSSDH